MNKCLSLIFLVLLFGLGSCSGCSDSPAQGGFEGGNPSKVVVSGSVTQADGACLADTAIARNQALEEVSVTIGADCSFSLELPVNTTYSLVFYLQNDFVAAVAFQTGGGESTPYFLLGEEAVDLGEIAFNGGVAMPANPPVGQSGGLVVEEIFGFYGNGTISGETETGVCGVAGDVGELRSDGGNGIILVHHVPLTEGGDPFAPDAWTCTLTGTLAAPGIYTINDRCEEDPGMILSCELRSFKNTEGQLSLTTVCEVDNPPEPRAECLYENYVQIPL